MTLKTLTVDALWQRPLEQLQQQANQIRKDKLGSKFELCSIMNAKSGLCSEDCRFCAQSQRHNAKVTVHPLKSSAEMLAASIEAKRIDAQKFGIVTSGNSLKPKELDEIAETIASITKEVGIDVCASLGALDIFELQTLKDSGLMRYHHNLETSPTYYKEIVTTHDFSERVRTVEAAKEAGLEVCSGGIIGLGESWTDRVEMAKLLNDLDVDAVPLNFLVPIQGTPLEDISPITAAEAIRVVAVFRIILKNKTIKIAAGRETVLRDSQLEGFMAGANGMLIGGYLTVKGRSVEEDHLLIKEIFRAWAE